MTLPQHSDPAVPGARTSIRPALEADLPPFFAYLDDHLRDNGADGTPLFQPLPRDQLRMPAGLRLAFIKGLSMPVGQPGWRRLWLALGPTGNIAGHIDLRARPEAMAAHRAMLGTGVQRLYRRRGLGRQLVDTAVAWARKEAGIDWVDLEVLADNQPAVALYLRADFRMIARIEDMVRVDGRSYDLCYMTLALR
jgi:ribosomal protein S18 acetylase RimI-like enzyme